jgi:hypothetical protein
MKKLLDGKKNAVLVFSGVFTDGQRVILLDGSDLEGEPTKLRLEAVLYALEKDVLITFDEIQIPLAGRGKIDFEQFHGIPVNCAIRIEGHGSFFLMLDLEKH